MSNHRTHLIMRPHRRCNVNITLPLKNHANITPPELEITDLLPLRKRHPSSAVNTTELTCAIPIGSTATSPTAVSSTTSPLVCAN